MATCQTTSSGSMNAVTTHQSSYPGMPITQAVNAFLCLMQGKLHGIITCELGKMESLKTDPIAWSTDVRKLIALCHDLVPLSKGKVVGRLDEQKAFARMEAAFLVNLALGMCFSVILGQL